MFALALDLARLARAGLVLARYDVLIPREMAGDVPWPLKLLGSLSRIGARGKDLRIGQRLALALAGQGPAYVKFGQLLATRPDIVGFEIAADLGTLQDRMPPFPTAAAKSSFEATTGRAVDSVFTSFSDAIAAASVAQVHKATTQDGREVAVKVLRPGIKEKAQREFRAFFRGARIIQALVPAVRRMEPVKLIQTFADSAALELDLRIEAGSASELGENLQDQKTVRIPEILWEYSGRNVLTLEWIEGCNVRDTEGLKQRRVDPPELACRVMQTFLSQAMDHGFFHADMHQGNMLVDAQGRLVLLDFGIMGRLDDEARRVFAEIIYGFIRRDYRAAAQAHFDAGYVPPHYSVDAFATALRSVGEPIFGRDAGGMNMSKVLQQLFDVTDVFDMHLRPELVMLQRTMVVVEGVARTIDPQINLWDTAEPVVKKYIAERVGPQALLRQARTNARAALSLFESFPQFAAAAEEAAQQLADGGISLSDDTVDRLAAAIKGKKKKAPKDQPVA